MADPFSHPPRQPVQPAPENRSAQRRAAPVVVEMALAVETVLRLVCEGAHQRAHAHPIIGITGPVGAGKSTLARALSPCVISTDDYLPDYDTTPEPLRDLPESSDLARLARDLLALREGRPTRTPLWSFQTHSRSGERDVAPPAEAGALIVVEGLHALHDAHAHALDLRIFVDAPASHRWSRWERLESSGQRGWGVDYARRFFHTVAEPTFANYAAAYRDGAHVIVNNAG